MRLTTAKLAIAPLLFLLTANSQAAGNGLKAEYYDNTRLVGSPVLVRTDSTINFNWDDDGPGHGVTATYFSARWTGQLTPPVTGNYQFVTESNNGIRVWVGDRLVIDNWISHSTTTNTSSAVQLVSGTPVNLKVEYYQDGGVAISRLSWILPGATERVVIPVTQLSSTPVTTVSEVPVWVSALNPVSAVNGWGPFERNQSNGERARGDGHTISIGGVQYAKGLGVHAISQLTYILEGKYTQFLSEIGIDDEVGNRGSVTFEVWLDGVKVFSSPVLRGSDSPVSISIPVAGKNELKLIVTDGGDGISYDHADWAGALLIPVVGGGTIPPVPSGVTATPGDAKVTLAWSASAGAVAYEIYRGTTPGGEGSHAIRIGVTGTSFVDTSVTNGTTYFYKIAAVNGAGTSAKSAEVSAKPSAGPPPPIPTNLTATPGDRQVTLQWTASNGTGVTYDVFRGTAAGGESTTAVKTGLTSPTFVDTGLTNGTTYFYKVTAVKNGSSSAPSNEASAKPSAGPPPPVPTNLTATPGDRQVTLHWTASAGTGVTYDVFRGTAAGAEGSTAIKTGVTSPMLVDTGLTNGTMYFYKVTAVANGSSSAPSTEASAKPAAVPAPAAPTNLTATAGNQQVVLAWSAVSGSGITYSVFRGTAAGAESTTPIVTGLTSPAYTNSGLTNGTTYFYTVTAESSGVSSTSSNEANAKPGPPPPPPVPTGLTALPGNQTNTLTWTASTGATSYNVYRGTTSNGESNTAIATGITATTFNDPNLTNGTTYFYKIAAVNANGTSAKSTEASAMPTAPGTILTQAQKDAFRFLRQSTFGPTQPLVDHVVQVGKAAFIDEQMALPPTAYPDTLIQMPNMELVSEQFFANAISGQDQLRQRVAWALSQIFVVSAVKVDNTDAMVPYIRMLEQRAFDNVKDVMHDVSLSPAMGEFLDMVNNQKADPTTGSMPNENYAREWLQLFSIGLVELNDDGTPRVGNPPTYTQATVSDMARALTGWTYGDNRTTNPTHQNPRYYKGPMKPVESLHDTGAKTILGVSFPAGQTAQQDFDMALTTVFNHHNVGPFLVRELIQKLVTSNPSPTYLSDIVKVFNDNGQGVRGDLKAVVKAILLHPEASATAAKFQEPALFLTTVCRALCTNITDHPFMSDFSESMAQRIWFAPSVFNYFSPNYRVGNLFIPEMQIWTAANALTRTNWTSSLLSGGFGGSVRLNLAAYTPVAGDPNALVDTVNAWIMGGTMTPDVRGAILTAVSATSNQQERIQTALYLAITSMQYQVEH